MSFQFTAFQLIDAHLELARRDPDYKFVLAEVDYLKPYWDTFPENRSHIARLVEDGRLEMMGGTYNEPNTNLTGAETTIRNAVYGVGFQRDVLGGEPLDRLAARRVRARPAVPRHDGRRRADLQRLGARAVPPVGADPGGRHLRHASRRPVGHAVPHRVRVDLPVRARPADPLHGRPLRRRLVDGLGADPGEGRRVGVRAVPRPEEGRRHPERAGPGRHRLQPAEQVADRHPPRLERPLRVAEVPVRDPRSSSRPSPPNWPPRAAACRRRPGT